MRHNLGSRHAHKLFLAFRIGFWGADPIRQRAPVRSDFLSSEVFVYPYSSFPCLRFQAELSAAILVRL